jgi:SsrA-binding protein
MADLKAKDGGVVAVNRRAHFDYELGERLEAGLRLLGSEARSLRQSGADVSTAWVSIDGRGEAWVKDMRIAVLPHAAFGHEEKRPRKLLLHRAEIDRLRGSTERDGLTLVVTRCHFKDGRAKLEIAVARGKKKHDKRHSLRERQATREALQSIRRRR